MLERLPPDLQNAWRRLSETARPYSPAFAIAMAVIAIPLALIYLMPLMLGLVAPKLDPAIDLYAVNRPLAFTFLDVDGKEVGHRGAVVGERLKLEEMPAYFRRLHRHGGPALLLPQRHRSGGFDPGAAAGSQGPQMGGGRLHHQPADRAKIVYTDQERTMSRKLTELINAAGLEKTLTKQQILQLYLNRIYLGQRRLWRGRRGAHLFRHQRAAAEFGAGRDAGDPDARAVGLLALPRPARAQQRATLVVGFHGR